MNQWCSPTPGDICPQKPVDMYMQKYVSEGPYMETPFTHLQARMHIARKDRIDSCLVHFCGCKDLRGAYKFKDLFKICIGLQSKKTRGFFFCICKPLPLFAKYLCTFWTASVVILLAVLLYGSQEGKRKFQRLPLLGYSSHSRLVLQLVLLDAGNCFWRQLSWTEWSYSQLPYFSFTPARLLQQVT